MPRVMHIKFAIALDSIDYENAFRSEYATHTLSHEVKFWGGPSTWKLSHQQQQSDMEKPSVPSLRPERAHPLMLGMIELIHLWETTRSKTIQQLPPQESRASLQGIL